MGHAANAVSQNERYVVYLDFVGLKPPFTRSEAKREHALSALVDSVKGLQCISSLKVQEKLGYPIGFLPIDEGLILITRDTGNDCTVHLYGCLMNIELTLMVLGVPLKGAVIKGQVDVNFEKETIVGSPLEEAFEISSSLEVFGTVFKTEPSSDEELRTIKKRTAEDIPLEYGTLIPTKTGLRRLSLVNWCVFFKNKKDVLDVMNNIKLPAHERELCEQLSNTRELFIDAFDQTWIDDE